MLFLTQATNGFQPQQEKFVVKKTVIYNNIREHIMYLFQCHRTLVGSTQSDQKALLLSAVCVQSGVFL